MIIKLLRITKIKRRNFRGKAYYKYTMIYDSDFYKFKQELKGSEKE